MSELKLSQCIMVLDGGKDKKYSNKIEIISTLILSIQTYSKKPLATLWNTIIASGDILLDDSAIISEIVLLLKVNIISL